jgi:hypothetical protein
MKTLFIVEELEYLLKCLSPKQQKHIENLRRN